MKIGIVFKEENKKAREIAQKAIDYLKNKGETTLGDKNLVGANYILTFGGDGTLIHSASRYAHFNVPFVGINTGGLGFLTAADSQSWQEAIDKIIAGKIFVSERMTIETTLSRRTTSPSTSSGQARLRPFRAVNEVVIKGLYRVIDLGIKVNSEDFLKISGDGVIVSTQTGSTAYSLSSGGPIVDPDLDCFLITPINPIGLPIPSAVLSPTDEIAIRLVHGDDISLIIDGQEHTKLSEGQQIKISRGKYNIKFGYFDKYHFLKALHGKFGLRNRIRGQ